ncbi:MAG: nickel-responsive transcriptional regulator NikR [Thermoplasmatota archaeon]
MPVERFGVSFEPELLEKFDSLIERKGYQSRSEAIRDLVRKSIIEADIDEIGGMVIGTLTYIYDHHEGDVTNRLMHIQHHHVNEIQSTTHVHIDHDMCLEVLIVRGPAEDVRDLGQNIMAIKGVKHGELMVTKVRV